ncbi:MAG: sigma-54-dependent Fis family transcriptional regulator [Bacteroidaceae bacterium]|nr:sigma-54-dependent Fis family transcriptional regulator [Bacteroidaceae bacterium]
MNSSELQNIKNRYNVIGRSSELDQALNVAIQVAPTDLSVLITGESGVGKEIIPRIIHDNSARKHKKFFAINCGSIPEGTIDSELFGHEKGAFTDAHGERDGYFATANGGTLFLDEVGELPLATQARLLRVLETGEYIRVGSSQVRKTDVRIVAATNVNLHNAIKERRFREDLYYRLNTIPIKMPPLRERGEDVVLLFRKFAVDISEKYGMPAIQLTDDAKQLLMQYSWPGNIRQLKNLTEQISIITKERVITRDILLQYITPDEQQSGLVLANPTGPHTFENERGIIYKLLFDLKNDVASLKQMINDSKKQTASTEKLRSEAVPLGGNLLDHGFPTTITMDGTPQGDIQYRITTSPHTNDNHMDITPAEVVEEAPLSMRDSEKKQIIQALERCHGKRRQAAEQLGISERTLYRKIKEYAIEV